MSPTVHRPKSLLAAAVAVLALAAALYAIGPRPVRPAANATGTIDLQPLVKAHGRGFNRLAAATVVDGQVSYGGLGADEHTEFEIGSISKVFTTDILRHYRDAGELSTSTEVGELLPGLPDSVAQLTLGELATHTSGLPANPGIPTTDFIRHLVLAQDPYDGRTPADLIEIAHSVEISGRGEYRYSNYGMSLLGHALAEHAGLDYPELLRQRITEPLELDETFAGAASDGAITGYSGSGRRAPAWDSPALAPAGGIRSTTADLAVFAQYILDSGDLDLGWVHNETEDYYWHNGMTGGFSSMMIIDRNRQCATVVLANTVIGPEDLAEDLHAQECQR